jgi:hypothetical protein
MTKLKTLKDFQKFDKCTEGDDDEWWTSRCKKHPNSPYFECCEKKEILDAIRQEAITWIKAPSWHRFLVSYRRKIKRLQSADDIQAIIEFIKYFFNITDKDLE